MARICRPAPLRVRWGERARRRSLRRGLGAVPVRRRLARLRILRGAARLPRRSQSPRGGHGQTPTARSTARCGSLSDSGPPVAPGAGRRNPRAVAAACSRLSRSHAEEEADSPRTVTSAWATSAASSPGGYLEITGRQKEIIIRMGENISPLEIENVLAASSRGRASRRSSASRRTHRARARRRIVRSGARPLR